MTIFTREVKGCVSSLKQADEIIKSLNNAMLTLDKIFGLTVTAAFKTTVEKPSSSSTTGKCPFSLASISEVQLFCGDC